MNKKEIFDVMLEGLDNHTSVRNIADQVGVSSSTIHRYMHSNNFIAYVSIKRNLYYTQALSFVLGTMYANKLRRDN